MRWQPCALSIVRGSQGTEAKDDVNLTLNGESGLDEFTVVSAERFSRRGADGMPCCDTFWDEVQSFFVHVG
jgi:hypothetical protein